VLRHLPAFWELRVFSRPVNLDQKVQHPKVPVTTDGGVGAHNTLTIDVYMKAAAQIPTE
jgi:hypothetical protein